MICFIQIFSSQNITQIIHMGCLVNFMLGHSYVLRGCECVIYLLVSFSNFSMMFSNFEISLHEIPLSVLKISLVLFFIVFHFLLFQIVIKLYLFELYFEQCLLVVFGSFLRVPQSVVEYTHSLIVHSRNILLMAAMRHVLPIFKVENIISVKGTKISKIFSPFLHKIVLVICQNIMMLLEIFQVSLLFTLVFYSQLAFEFNL